MKKYFLLLFVTVLLSCGGSSSSSTDADGDGFLASVNDCNDSDANVNPDATEVCDNVDNDCDGETDENDASDVTTWYFDGDEDTFGDPDTTTTACDQPTNFVSDNTDCDDDDATINTSGTETFNNKDDDCNDIIDDEVSVAQATTIITGANSGDQLGFAVSTAGDFDNDGNGDVIISAPYEDANGVDAGEVYLFYGDISSGSLDTSNADVNIPGEAAGDEFGFSLAGNGDADNDGVGDIMIGAPGESTNGSDCGGAYLVYGETTQYQGGKSLSNCTGATEMACRRQISGTTDDRTGFDVTFNIGLDDADIDDFIFSVPFRDDTLTNDGHVRQKDGRDGSRFSGNGTSIAGGDGNYIGESSNDETGKSLANGGNIDNANSGEHLIGAPGEDSGGSNAGAAYIVGQGEITGDMTLSSASAKLTGESADDAAGTSVGGNGDLNGDGFSDVLVGAPGDDTGGTNAGAVYVIYGSASGISDMSLSAADVKFYSDSGGDQLGGSKDAIDFAGDVNGDGYDDILVAASSANSNTGAVWLIYGSATTYSGDIDLADLNTSGNPTGVKFVGISENDLLGFSVSRAGDVDGDGKDDILFGAPGRDSSKGAAYLFKSPF